MTAVLRRAGGAVKRAGYRVLLRVFQSTPRPVRRRVVRLVQPSYTVGAICVVERDDGSVLLVRHSYRQRWGTPGGLANRREDIRDCARREVSEEVGLEVELVGEPAVVIEAGPQRVDVVFRARPAPGADPDAVRRGSVEIQDVRWFPRDRLPELQHETAQAMVALDRATGHDLIEGSRRTLRGLG